VTFSIRQQRQRGIRDRCRDPEAVFGAVVRFCGMVFDAARVRKAVAFSDFAELKRQEQANGFRERSTAAPGRFFRSGQVGSWRRELSPALAQRLIAAHGDTMRRFGYLEENLSERGVSHAH
ncbi:hypothetical protein D4R89_04755, partial [bacterium]